MIRHNRNLRQNSPDALDELLQRGFRYALALAHHPAQAEDLVQEACLKLLSRSMAIELPVFFKIIRNRFIDLYRHAKRFPTDSLSSEAGQFDQEMSLTAFHDAAHIEEGDILSKSLGKLSPEEREAFYLWAVEGYTAKEIAGIGSVSRNTVLSRIHRARKKLRHILHEFDTEVAP